mgnify:CR=1 FL=1
MDAAVYCSSMPIFASISYTIIEETIHIPALLLFSTVRRNKYGCGRPRSFKRLGEAGKGTFGTGWRKQCELY